MFQKLKIRLILINVVSITIVLIMLFSGLYFLMKQGMNRQAYIMMDTIAREERIMPPMGGPEAGRGLSGSFFIKIDESGKILEYSPGLNLSKADVDELLESVLKKGIPNGNAGNKNYRLRFLKVSKVYGYIIVFLDNSMEQDTLRLLVIASAFVGLASMTLVLIISLVLANKAIKPVKASWEKQNTFVADASHELRTPLAVVNSNLEIVMENENETVGSQYKWLGNIRSELERMIKLVEDLLFLARADAEDEVMSKEVFDLTGLLNKIYDSFLPLVRKQGLVLKLHNNEAAAFFGNEFRIKQLITILLDNAIKNTQSGGTIDLSLESGAGTFQLLIRDNGEGIPREHLLRIFDRFYRVDKSRSRSQGGTGLGLAIAKCIVNEHKGSINVASEVGKGTEFKIVFPAENHK